MKRSENPYNKNLCVDMCRQIYNIVYILIYRCTCTYLHRTITLIHPDVCSLLTMFFRTSGASLITVGYSGHVLFEGKRELKSTSGLWILDLLIYNFSMSVHLQKINFANGSWKDGMHLSVVFNRSHCSGKDRKKNRTDSCVQQENSDSRTM